MFPKLAKSLAVAAVLSLPFANTAVARTASLHHPDGAKVNIQCSKRACFVRHTNAAGYNGSVEPAGPATTVNFVRIVKIWQAKGYR
ncbi:MAG: hypothetical protein ACR2O3_04625 [Rhizobiaceae bacterium]